MVEDTSKEYKETMQEVMLELKLSTTNFLKIFKEECKKSKLNQIIPITISLGPKFLLFYMPLEFF